MQTKGIDMELLAPAGGWEQLRAAIDFGADAVYLATDRFGMRARADNFALADMPAVVALAHASGVKVHVACNVLMFPDDIAELPAYFETLEDAGVDALIINDLGAFRLARRHASSIDIHVSTQASVANGEAACQWYELGAKRIVCAREMSLDDIRKLREQTPRDLEIEAFVHGAMCMAVSGRCLISAYLTGRSGNRGHCTQPCRWNYTLEEEKRPGEHFPVEEDARGTFIMNAKDMNMLAHLEELADVGVDSIKIEGRNKKAFYVATVVNAYRRVLDGTPASEIAPELETISHRPYGTGFYFGEAEQAPDYDGYEQTCLHVADVLSCDPSNGGYTITVRCRNRFAEKDRLEVLEPPLGEARLRLESPSREGRSWSETMQSWESPSTPLTPQQHEPGRTVSVNRLIWLPDPTEDDPAPEPVPVAVANRSRGIYRFSIDAPVRPGSFLRIRQFRRSARHEAEGRAPAVVQERQVPIAVPQGRAADVSDADQGALSSEATYAS